MGGLFRSVASGVFVPWGGGGEPMTGGVLATQKSGSKKGGNIFKK